MTQGLFRDAEGWVRVRYGDGREIDVPKARYVRWGWEPPFEALPLASDVGEARRPREET
jgi:hypothetical protein